MRSSVPATILTAMRIDGSDARLTNGSYELPRSARGVLILADPPEAGWRLRPPGNGLAAALCESHPAASDPTDRPD